MIDSGSDRRPSGTRPSSDPEADREVCQGQQRLLAAVAAGDRGAFAELYDLVAARLFGLIVNLTRDRSVAEDILQDVFLHIWRRAGDYNPQLAKPMVWMMMIARGKSIDHLRRRGTLAAAMAGWRGVAAMKAGDRGVEIDVDREKARHALASLPSEQSEAITLAFHGGLTSAEIALHRGVPLGTIKTRIRLGMRKLREALGSQCEVTA